MTNRKGFSQALPFVVAILTPLLISGAINVSLTRNPIRNLLQPYSGAIDDKRY